jgi:CO dehydrogenase nickel-insertion accessory protein CooC1
VVSLASAKGSPGVTFLAAALAARLAAGAVDVLALDADAEDTAFALALGLPDTDGGAAFARSAALGVITPDLLRRVAAPAGRRLWLLESQQAPDVAGSSLLAAAAAAGFGAIVVDLGHLPGRLQRELAAGSDWLAWVVMPDRLGLDRADRLLAAPPLAAASAGLVFNRVGEHTLKGAEKLLSERHRLPILARVPEDRRAARRAGIQLARPFRGPVAELARAVAPAAAPAVAAWP